MISRIIGLTSACAALYASTTLGQGPGTTKDVDVFRSQPAATADLFRYQLVSAGSNASATMAEDTEIFRRILDKALEPWTGFVSWMTPVFDTGAQGQIQPLFGGSKANAPYFGGGFPGTTGSGFSGNIGGGFSGNTQSGSPFSGMLDANQTFRSWPRYTLAEHPAAKPEGVYLPGYGVLFTVTLPWDGQDPLGKSAPAESKPISDWDRVRKEMQGEKVPAPKQPGKKTPSLAEAVLKVLAENGHHFSSLTTNERVTVAITLRPTTASGGTVILGGLKGASMGGLSGGVQHRNLTGAANQGDRHAGPRSEAANFVNLGNQRLGQKRPDDAIDAYRKAIDLYQKILGDYHGTGSNIQDHLSDAALAADAWSRLAKVYLTVGKRDEADKILENLAKTYDRLAQSRKSESSSKGSEAKAPAKLIISATKPVLDRAGTGKMSLSDFRGEASVEFFSLPHEGKAPAKKDDSNKPKSDSR